MNVAIYDTTLRDGTQREGISLSLADKLKITRLLDNLGVTRRILKPSSRWSCSTRELLHSVQPAARIATRRTIPTFRR
jgi:hypothetical protein